MPRGQLSSEEADAGAVLAAVLNGTWQPRDVPGAPDGTPDLAIDTGGTTVIVEVTSVVNRRRRSRNNAAYKQAWTDPRLSRDWVVVFQDEPSPNFAQRMPALAAHLALMEAFEMRVVGINWLHGRWPVDPEFPLPPPESGLERARCALRDMQVELARSPHPRTSRDGGLMELHFVVPSGADPWGLTTLVGERMRAKANKLRLAAGDARHLFVWLDPTESEAYLAAVRMDERMPNPTLPPGVDVVWIATRYFPGYESVSVGGVRLQQLARVTSGGGWQAMSLAGLASQAASAARVAQSSHHD